jgi:hypothetical protein
MEDALKRLEKTISGGRLKDRNKMERRLGKIQARHPQVNDLFEVALRETPEGLRLVWGMKEIRKARRDLREGAYLLRTNLQAGSAQELWSKYMQLTEAEALAPTSSSLGSTVVTTPPANCTPGYVDGFGAVAWPVTVFSANRVKGLDEKRHSWHGLGCCNFGRSPLRFRMSLRWRDIMRVSRRLTAHTRIGRFLAPSRPYPL